MTLKDERQLDILSRFTNHKPDPATLDKMATVRTGCRSLARIIEELCPQSSEKETAIHYLTLVMMNANLSIVQECPINIDDLTTAEQIQYGALTREST